MTKVFPTGGNSKLNQVLQWLGGWLTSWTWLTLKIQLLCHKEPIPVQTVELSDGETVWLSKYLDDLDGWGGTTYVRREGTRLFVGTSRMPYRSGPSLSDSIYVNLFRVAANTEVEVGASDVINQREQYSDAPPLRRILVCLK